METNFEKRLAELEILMIEQKCQIQALHGTLLSFSYLADGLTPGELNEQFLKLYGSILIGNMKKGRISQKQYEDFLKNSKQVFVSPFSPN